MLYGDVIYRLYIYLYCLLIDLICPGYEFFENVDRWWLLVILLGSVTLLFVYFNHIQGHCFFMLFLFLNKGSLGLVSSLQGSEWGSGFCMFPVLALDVDTLFTFL